MLLLSGPAPGANAPCVCAADSGIPKAFLPRKLIEAFSGASAAVQMPNPSHALPTIQ